jgi:putative membrane protein
MVVDKQISLLTVLFSVRGTVLPRVGTPVLLVTLFAVLVSAAPEVLPMPLPEITLGPFSLLGIVLSVFLGFRNNVCYDRWWEGRKQWGVLIAESRALARTIAVYLPRDDVRKSRMLRRVIGFAACLAARLRDRDQNAAAAPFLPPEEAAALTGAKNPPAAILAALSRELAEAQRRGEIGENLLVALEAHVEALNGVQAGCERIDTTPTPFSYTLLLHRTSWFFCLLAPFGLVGACGWATPFVTALLAYAFFGLDALGDELERPFGLMPNHLPLDALVRTIEIELLQAAGETNLPEKLQPKDFILT